MSARDWARAIETTQRLRQTAGATLPGLVMAAALTRGEAAALIGKGETLSYAGLADRGCRYARWARGQGVAAGDVVALLMPNCADYVAIWLGLTQVGCVVALLNTNMAGDALVHGIVAAGARQVIVAGALGVVADAARAALPADIAWWGYGAPVAGARALPRLDHTIAGIDGGPLGALEQRPPAPGDRALLIYTSGTTGLPKAANISHARVLEWSGWFAGMIDARAEDRLYDCLPLYHSTGGVVAVGCMLLSGGSVVIRERFSARRFWDDVADTGCTIVQYIGELCRYLLQSPVQPGETAHRLRLCCGNGLRGEVWEAFQARFAIPRILEFYAATEGGISLYNCEGRPGAIGRVPGFLAHRFPLALIRYDAETAVPLRGADGLCVRCETDEAGEAIAPVGAAVSFDGYTDAAASARKLLHDVFAPGDVWFRSGDLMRRDAGGYYYFVDRLGDTYRWKGENVSTTEVAAVVAACPGVIEAVVYGVAVAGAEGKAGMAALVVNDGFSLPALHAAVQARLAPYARPLFVRICPTIATTGTFKLSKTALAREGFAESADPVWIDDRAAGGFVRFDAAGADD